MQQFISLKQQSGKDVVINKAHVCNVSKSGDGSRISMINNDVLYVCESVGQVVAKIEVIG
jgi:uncharacterized protein YlzI (FlbEa/FlbD family)